jgi:hypothetical protein
MKKYSFADYGFQFITVTAGVLIALFIDGFVESNHNRELVVTAREMLAREVADNLQELSGLSKSVASSNADIDNGLKLANDLLSKGKSDVHQLRLNFNLATLSDASWQSADRTGALGLMDYDEVRKYSELYTFQELFDSQQRKAIDMVAASSALIAPSFDPTTANKQDVAKFREQLMQLQANLMVTEKLGTQLLEAYSKFQPGK